MRIENKNIKVLIAGGCSFTQIPVYSFTEVFETKIVPKQIIKNIFDSGDIDSKVRITWPIHLSLLISCSSIFEGRGACGNGIISRSIIEATEFALKKYEPEEILVGVMWSGRDRGEYFFNDKPNYTYDNLGGQKFKYYKNPMNITTKANYYITNSHWNDEISKHYYSYYDDHGATQKTLEHILRIQWYLKNKNIKYFFSEYHSDVLPKTEDYTNHPDLKTLYELLDMDNFLPCTNCYDWCLDFGSYEYLEMHGNHPSSEQSLEFTEKVIIPHLITKKIL